MDNKVIYRMVGELQQQAKFGFARFQTLRTRLNEPDQEKVFLEVQALFGHAILISRLLWPERPASLSRGETLRGELKIPADSALRMSGLRDQITRWDEAYEDWLATLPEAGYVDFNLMPSGTMLGSREDVFQWNLDPDTLVLQLRGVSVDLRKVGDALRALDGATQAWLRTHNPW